MRSLRRSPWLPMAICLMLGMPAQAQEAAVQRSSSPSGIRIQGDTAVRAQAVSSNAAAVGADNVAKTATGTVRGNVKIQGNTRIDARSNEVNAVAAGKGNKADNSVGAIGGR
ncbi:MAG: hypothetical protein AB1642_01310 [Pseudomonadota bacterium]